MGKFKKTACLGVVFLMILTGLFFSISSAHAGGVDYSYMKQNLYKFEHGKYGTAFVKDYPAMHTLGAFIGPLWNSDVNRYSYFFLLEDIEKVLKQINAEPVQISMDKPMGHDMENFYITVIYRKK